MDFSDPSMFDGHALAFALVTHHYLGRPIYTGNQEDEVDTMSWQDVVSTVDTEDESHSFGE
jgi:hypothetical protein